MFANVKNVFISLSSPADVSTPSNWPGNNRDRGSHRAQYPLNSSSVYHSGSGAAPSGSLPPNSGKNNTTFDRYGRPCKHGYDSYNAAIPFPDLRSTPAPNEGSPALPTQSAKTARALSNATSSLPEGSTVGNIYKHYVRSEIFDDVDSDCNDAPSEYDLADGYSLNQHFGNRAADKGISSSSLSSSQRQSALNLRKQRRAQRLGGNLHGQPPGYALPKIPSPSPCLLPSSSQGIGHSSSYEDTHNLLELTGRSQRTGNNPKLSRPNGRGDLLPGQASSHMGSLSSTPYLSPNNPFRVNHGPQVLISQATDYGYDNHRHYHRVMERQPLEREVSEALRRASNFSAYSNGSIAASVLEHYVQFQSEESSSNGLRILKRHIENSPSSEPDVDEETRAAAAQAQAFYDRGAIPSTWIGSRQQNQVRVPIQHHDLLPNSPPISPDDLVDFKHGNQRGQNDPVDDANDWETAGESAFGTEFKGSTPGMLGGAVAHRAGSSIANASDEGTASSHIPEISNYGSTERIAQHPGNIQYFGDYRQRDLKNSHIPVFLPVFGEHKVNGYLADSNRLRPPRNPFNYYPRPLDRKHTNPFNSPPPEVMTKKSGSKPYTSMSCDHRAPQPNYFPPSTSIKTSTSSNDSDMAEQHVATAALARSDSAGQNFSQPFDWMDDFGDPGPAINYSNQTFLMPIPPVAAEEGRPSSWQHIMAFAYGDDIEGYNPDGTRTVDSPFGRGFMKEHRFSDNQFSLATNSKGKTQTDGFVEQKTYGGKKGPTKSRERNTLVKGPPGAFYHGLSRPKTIRSQSHDTERSPKVKVLYRQSSAKDYPTNALRPLSLVASRQRHRPVTPIDSFGCGPDPSANARPNDFVYRSPLAPPKRKSWQKLYTEEQLSGFREAAKADGFRESRAVDLNAGLLGHRESVKEGGSRKHLWEAPRLFQWPREVSVRTDLPKKKNKLSNIVLALCNLFPPLLLLYALGRLDGIIAWWTSGEFITFGRPQKRAAYVLLGAWAILVLCGLVFFLVWWFANRSSAST